MKRRPQLFVVVLVALVALAALSIPLPAASADLLEDKGVVLQRARGQQTLANYEEAARGYEAFAQAYPADSEALTVLKDAIVLRLGLGQLDLAAKDTELFAKSYGAKQPSELVVVLVTVANALLDHDDFPAGKKLLDTSIALIDRAAPFDKRILAHTLLGRACLQLGDQKRAEEEFDKVRALWKDPAAGLKTFESQGADSRRIALSLTAIGEALFFFAEQKRALADSIPFPVYSGGGGRDDVQKHLSTKVADWVKKKRPAIELAEREYLKIVQIQPAPPPRWVIAAAARVGQTWGRFVSDFRSSPTPKEWLSGGKVPGTDMTYAELRQTYFKAIDEAAEPQKQAAKGAFKTCLNTSLKYRYFHADTEACIEWLTRHYRAEFPRIEELRPRAWLLAPPGLSGEPLPEPK